MWSRIYLFCSVLFVQKKYVSGVKGHDLHTQFNSYIVGKTPIYKYKKISISSAVGLLLVSHGVVEETVQ